MAVEEEAVTLLQATNLAQAKSNSRGIPEVADADVHVDKHDGIKKLSGLLGQQSPDQAAAKEQLSSSSVLRSIWEFPKIRGTLFWGPIFLETPILTNKLNSRA